MSNKINCITSVPIQNQKKERMNISLGSEKNGVLILNFQDTSELGQDTPYINDDAFPNSGLMAWGKYSLWLSMFGRHVQSPVDDGED